MLCTAFEERDKHRFRIFFLNYPFLSRLYEFYLSIKDLERGSCMVWEINMGACPRLVFENIMLFNCLGPELQCLLKLSRLLRT